MISAFPLAIQRQIALIALKNVNPGDVIQRSLIPDHVISSDVVPVIDSEHDGFFRLCLHPVDFIPGKLSEIRPHGRKNDSFLCPVAVLVRNVFRRQDFDFLIFQLYRFHLTAVFKGGG